MQKSQNFISKKFEMNKILQISQMSKKNFAKFNFDKALLGNILAA